MPAGRGSRSATTIARSGRDRSSSWRADVPHRFHDITERLVPGRGLRAGGGLAATSRRPAAVVRGHRSSRASSGPRPVSSWRKNTYASSPAARNGSSRAAQAAISSRRVVVAAQAQVQERAGPAEGRAARDRRAGSVAHRTRAASASAANVSSRASDVSGTRRSAAGRAATPRGTPPAARRRAARRRGPGRAPCPAAPRTPGTDRSATAARRSGSADSARNEPPRWALTLNRKSAGVAASQAATLAARRAAGRTCCSARPPSSRVA